MPKSTNIDRKKIEKKNRYIYLFLEIGRSNKTQRTYRA